MSTGDEYTARYLVTAMGILHQPYLPEIPGLETFKGRTLHSSQWKPDVEYKGKNVAVIGTVSLLCIMPLKYCLFGPITLFREPLEYSL